MATRQPITNLVRSDDYGALQKVVDALFDHSEYVRRVDAIVLAESYDVCDDLLDIMNLLPPGTYDRQNLCDQLNSAIAGHAWGQVYGTVE